MSNSFPASNCQKTQTLSYLLDYLMGIDQFAMFFHSLGDAQSNRLLLLMFGGNGYNIVVKVTFISSTKMAKYFVRLPRRSHAVDIEWMY